MLVARGREGSLNVLNVPIHDRVPGRERPVVSAVGMGDFQYGADQPAATRASLKKSAGIDLASFQVIAIGRSPR